jgi:uracil-DNA glycosylase
MSFKSPGSLAVSDGEKLDTLASAIRACRICRDQPRYGKPLPHEPRPVLQVSETVRICIASQAPGTRVHASGRPFDDPSGVRLRQWMGIDEADFYDSSKVAILPMGFCFPGLRSDGSDLPPRRECAEIWRERLFARLPNLKLLLAIGGYAQRRHFGAIATRQGVNDTVRLWREIYESDPSRHTFPLPHPSWHNNRWLKINPWFETELLPVLRQDVRRLLSIDARPMLPHEPRVRRR